MGRSPSPGREPFLEEGPVHGYKDGLPCDNFHTSFTIYEHFLSIRENYQSSAHTLTLDFRRGAIRRLLKLARRSSFTIKLATSNPAEFSPLSAFIYFDSPPKWFVHPSFQWHRFRFFFLCFNFWHRLLRNRLSKPMF